MLKQAAIDKRNSKELICKIYFGITDYSYEYDYLQDDISNNLKSQLRVWIISEILNEISTPIKCGDGSSKSLDWDYGKCAVDLLSVFRTESLVQIRKILGHERYNSKLIERKVLEKCEIGSQTGGSFILDISKDQINDKITKEINKYKNAEYYKTIVLDNEKVLLHKDNGKPKRYFVEEKHLGNCTIRRHMSNTNFDASTIIAAMEHISKIIVLFLEEKAANLPHKEIIILEEFVRMYYKLFFTDKEIDELKSYKKIIKSIKIALPNSLLIAGWK